MDLARRGPVIRGASAILCIVLPLATVDVRFVEVRLIEVGLIIVVYVLVVIVHVLVVHVDIDITVAPSAIPTPVTAPSSSQRDTGPERNRRSRRIISWRRVVNRRIRISRWTIYHSGVV